MAALRGDFAWLLGSRVATMGVGVVTGGLVNRALGPAGRGVLAEMQTWVGLFAVLCGLSLDSALYHFANRERYGEDDSRRFATAMPVALATSALAALLLALFVRASPGRVSSETAALLVPLGVLLAATMVGGALLVFYQAIGRVRFAAAAGAVQSGAYLGLLGGAALAGRITLGFVVGALVASQAVVIALTAWRSRREGLWRGRFSREMARGILGAGARQHVATVAGFVYTKVNQLIVFRQSGEAEAGLFAAALNLAFALAFVPAAFQTVLYPRVVHASDEFEVTVRSLRLGFYGWGAVSAVLALLAEPILLLYGGEEFRGAAPAFRILLLSSWLLPLASLIAPYYVKAGAFGLASATAVVLGAVSVGLNLALIPRLQGLGAALATSLTCLVGFAMALGMLAHLSRRNPLVFLAPRGGR